MKRQPRTSCASALDGRLAERFCCWAAPSGPSELERTLLAAGWKNLLVMRLPWLGPVGPQLAPAAGVCCS